MLSSYGKRFTALSVKNELVKEAKNKSKVKPAQSNRRSDSELKEREREKESKNFLPLTSPKTKPIENKNMQVNPVPHCTGQHTVVS